MSTHLVTPAPAAPPLDTSRRLVRARPGARWRRALVALTSVCVAALLAACGTSPKAPVEPVGRAATPHASAPRASTPRITLYDGPDGPEPHPPPHLLQVPDAVPRVELLRIGSPNRPYAIRGQDFLPLTSDVPVRERGVASWYGRKFHGRRTASGEVYDMYAMTAAHPTLPIPSYARVRNRNNGRTVIVRINDRGPFKAGRIIDLSYTAGLKLGFVKGSGTAPVELERLTHEAIRSGDWRLGEPFADASPGGVALLQPD